MNGKRGENVIFYGIIAIAVVGAVCVLVLNFHTTSSALEVSYTATTTAVSDTNGGNVAVATSSAASDAATSGAKQPSSPEAILSAENPPLFSSARFIVSGPMTFELSTTSAQQEQGLSDRSAIPDNYAMIFVFPEDENVGFWMKDMNVPLDIIWLSDTGKVLGIEASLAANTYPNVFYPPQPVKYVLETKAGFMAEHGIEVGNQFPNLPQLPNVSE